MFICVEFLAGHWPVSARATWLFSEQLSRWLTDLGLSLSSYPEHVDSSGHTLKAEGL